MVVTQCSWIVLSILTVEGITCHFYPPINPNNRLYNGNYNRNYNGNYNMNFNPGILRYPETGVRPGELIAEMNDNAGQTPCRNKDANKKHKDSLWWTLPIPPSELEGPPEKPLQIKQPEPPTGVQQMETSLKPQAPACIKTGPAQQKHSSTSTAKVQAVPGIAPTSQAVSQVITTGRHETSTSLYKQEKSKVAQTQKQQQQGQAQAMPQNSIPVPSQFVVSNKENQQYLINNKSMATMRALGRVVPPVNSHGTNKQKAMLNMNLMGAGYQYGQEGQAMSPAYLNNPYYNPQYQREFQLDANRGYRSDAIDSISALRDNMYKNFDSNEAELGGANVVGENKQYASKQIPVVVYEHNFAPISQQGAPIDQWPIGGKR